MKIVVVPGWQNSGEGHWQSIWERDLPDAVRIAPPSWEHPRVDEWVAAIESATDGESEVLLVAHSIGCLAAAEWMVAHPDRTAGALLVAPPDRHGPSIQSGSPTFVNLPVAMLPGHSVVVASDNDPFCGVDTAREFATGIGATFIEAGAAGHLNADAGYGPWPEGRQLLDRLIARTTRGSHP